MSNTQVVLPPSKEEDAVVERFVTASREIVPTVQVSLAKRIIQPGSNRMICLAAHTSVPLNENELASVSDLALRLSDGTNVRLSVSFFNDGDTIGGDFIPYERTIYDPNRYSMKGGGDSKLGLVLCTMAAIAFGSYYAYSNNSFNPLAPPTKTPLKSAVVDDKPPAPKFSEKGKQSNIALHTVKASPANADSVPETPARSYGRNPKSAPKARAERVSSGYSFQPGDQLVRSKASKNSPHQAHDTMLVPPPPPFALPLGSDTSQYSPGFNLIANPGAAWAAPAAKTPNASSHGRPQKPDVPAAASTQAAAKFDGFSRTDAPGSIPAAFGNRPAQKVEFDADVLLPGAASARSTGDYTSASVPKYQPVQYSKKAETTPVEASPQTNEPDRMPAYGTATTTAPVPGSSLQLERIAAPEQ